MTVADLIGLLSAMDQNAPARLAVNPFYPMAHTIAAVVSARDEEGRSVVFLAESGEQLGHLPPDVAVRLTWQEPTVAPPHRRRRTARPDIGQ
ncbi:hypothetical protein AB0D49_39665 [Streptomyces sp. NPDC048290]|uniref:hypothetical protein n=1 Tax=Streptomyces sp. NPDC048290 TaxID=3155811 RepID=UPI00342FE6FF